MRFFVEEAIDDCLGGENTKLLRIKLARGTHDLAQNFIAYRLRRFDFAATCTGGTWLTQNMGQAFTRALSGHLDQAKLRKSVYRYARTITRQRLPEFGEDSVFVFFAIHVNEVNNDNTAKVTQSQLPRNRLCGFKIGFENSVIETAPGHKPASVHINGDERFGLVDDDVAARL